MPSRYYTPPGLSLAWEEHLVRKAYRNYGDFHNTQLTSPYCYWFLMNRHEDEIVIDVRDAIYRIIGDGVHGALKEAAPPGTVCEQVHIIPFKIDGTTYKIAVRLDRLEPTDEGPSIVDLVDFKVTSWYSFKYGGKDEWSANLNTTNAFLTLIGWDIRQMRNELLIRDWRWTDRYEKQLAGYPDKPLCFLRSPIWAPEQTLSFITERVRGFLRHQTTPDADLPPCSPAERWEKKGGWTCQYVNSKRAVSGGGGHETREGAVAAQTAYDDKTKSPQQTEIVEKPGESTRCRRYCEAWKFCPHFERFCPQGRAEGIDTIPDNSEDILETTRPPSRGF